MRLHISVREGEMARGWLVESFGELTKLLVRVRYCGGVEATDQDPPTSDKAPSPNRQLSPRSQLVIINVQGREEQDAPT